MLLVIRNGDSLFLNWDVINVVLSRQSSFCDIVKLPGYIDDTSDRWIRTSGLGIYTCGKCGSEFTWY